MSSGNDSPGANGSDACPNCGAQVPQGRVTCEHCGEVVQMSPEEFAAHLPPPMAAPPPGSKAGVFEAAARSGWQNKPVTLLDPSEAAMRRQIIFKGIGWGNLVGLIIVGLGYVVVHYLARGSSETPQFADSGTYMLLEMLIAPIVVGFLTGCVWAPVTPSCGEIVGYTILSQILQLCIAAIFLHEGVICLGMAAPGVFVIELAAAAVGIKVGLLRPRLRLSIVPLVIVFFIHDVLSSHNYDSSVTDKVVIHAPASVVWSHLASFSQIHEPSHFWMFDQGLPMPMQSLAQSASVGSPRQCIFNHGDVFEEQIIDATPNKRLAFDILHQPSNPEVFNHATIREGEFDLQQNRDGSTTLTGITRYSLHVFPGCYFDLWAQAIGSNVHLRVMDHIKDECEHVKAR